MTGLTLPGMIDEPFWSSGRRISPRPARGPEPIQREVVGDLGQRDRDDLERAGELDERVAAALRLEGVLGRADLEAGLLGQPRAHALGELGVRVEAGAGRGAAERDLRRRGGSAIRTRRRRGGSARRSRANSWPSVTGTASIRCVRPVLTMSSNCVGLGGHAPLERRPAPAPGRWSTSSSAARWTARREDVVGRLAHVHVVVGVGAVAGEVGDDLVGVHVRRGARAGLEDVDRELVVVLAVGDLVGRGGDALGDVAVEQAEPGVGARRRALDAPQPVHDRQPDALAGDLEVPDRLGGLSAPELLFMFDRHVLEGTCEPATKVGGQTPLGEVEGLPLGSACGERRRSRARAPGRARRRAVARHRPRLRPADGARAAPVPDRPARSPSASASTRTSARPSTTPRCSSTSAATPTPTSRPSGSATTSRSRRPSTTTSREPAQARRRACGCSAPGSPPLHRFRVGLEFAALGPPRGRRHARPARRAGARRWPSSSGCPTAVPTRSAPPTSSGTARAGRASSPATASRSRRGSRSSPSSSRSRTASAASTRRRRSPRERARQAVRSRRWPTSCAPTPRRSSTGSTTSAPGTR